MAGCYIGGLRPRLLGHFIDDNPQWTGLVIFSPVAPTATPPNSYLFKTIHCQLSWLYGY
jgi:hypothetical protein